MALRHRYGYNGQSVNFANFTEFTPLGYVETVPGETIQGTVSIKARSQPLLFAPDTRAYFDCFAFYVPFRLLWSGWPDFISREQNVAEVGAPTVTTLFPFNFESRFTLGTAPALTALPVWSRRTYNKVWNQFFRPEGQAEAAEDGNTVLTVRNRASTMETRTEVFNVPSTPIPSGTIDDLRRAFTQDVYAKMRNFYGSKYVDYLSALGVKTDWAVLQEPELIGQYHGDWPFKQVTLTQAGGTSPNVPGQTMGHFMTRAKLRIKRTFSPEHGLIAFYGVARADPLIYNSGAGAPMPVINGKNQREQFWNPEYETLQKTTYPGNVFYVYADQNAPGYSQWQFLKYEEYRTGQNIWRDFPSSGLQYALFAPNTTNFNNSRYSAPAAGDFNVNMSISTWQHYQVTAETRLTRHSPVRRELPRLRVT